MARVDDLTKVVGCVKSQKLEVKCRYVDCAKSSGCYVVSSTRGRKYDGERVFGPLLPKMVRRWATLECFGNWFYGDKKV